MKKAEAPRCRCGRFLVKGSNSGLCLTCLFKDEDADREGLIYFLNKSKVILKEKTYDGSRTYPKTKEKGSEIEVAS